MYEGTPGPAILDLPEDKQPQSPLARYILCHIRENHWSLHDVIVQSHENLSMDHLLKVVYGNIRCGAQMLERLAIALDVPPHVLYELNGLIGPVPEGPKREGKLIMFPVGETILT